MIFENGRVSDIKIAYIGGGSRGWAWGLMSDLAQASDICGQVYLYDIDREAAQHNEEIGNGIKGGNSVWTYKAADSLKEALTGANFVVISILPGTFDEMESDVHAPEKYGIYQSVGDTFGPGGLVRSLRCIPMFEEIALAIKEFCPEAWVINYTNPMTLSVAALYRAFPEIKAFGCCHEVFGTQMMLASALEEFAGIEGVEREEIKINVLAVNHFTWITKAHYKDIDVFPIYRQFAEKYKDIGNDTRKIAGGLKCFQNYNKVKIDLFLRYGVIAAAGDRHLAEFCPGDWYLKSPEQVDEWKFGLTPVSWRKADLKERLESSVKFRTGEDTIKLRPTGEEGVRQMRAILGLEDLCTNVNLPNRGQIPNLPLGAVVESNAVFTSNSVTPVFAGPIPTSIMPLVSRVVTEQQIVLDAAYKRDLDMAFSAFACDPLVRLSLSDARKLFNEMIANTADYLGMYRK
ncbi:MAG: alpha-glucosidase/alpha-galactosidase [Ruminococcaceae bacterium]|nr:alpha-glucosidase/alpha-galactosidase [Oscillospiraceae bacterium]